MPVERSIHGSGAPGNRFRAASRLPPCKMSSAPAGCVIGRALTLPRCSGSRMFAELAFTALVIELAFGYPDAIYRWIGHPVSWIGALIAWCDRAWNRQEFSFERRRMLGVATLLLLLAVSVLSGAIIFLLAQHFLAGFASTLVCGAVACYASCPAQPRCACPGRCRCAGAEGHRGGPSCRVDDRRTRHAKPGRSRCQPRRHREPCREFFRRRRGAAVLVARCRIARHFQLQGDQYRRQHDRPQIRPLSRLWLGVGASGRSRQSAGIAALCVLAGAGLSDDIRALSPRRDHSGVARCAKTPLAECGMARGCNGWSAGCEAWPDRVPIRERCVDDHWIGDGRETASAPDIRAALRQYRVACAIQLACVAGLAAAMALL